ncbi:hypothetical protein PV10_05322 [Exophiala mesophila]|uniref:Pyridoxamine 5'-phosphate oxidase Alr4036 family FMN-binding domain-containing protein n=1 Tax=Exophiala mesophila TaxID=212818 RepID=A0A0D1Z9J8_EXOME|nr:uncharacterized protein PV10_05322 [Exophiala mesophila]KIV90694.1 hypothetical protein PV10_05322 [Exophiala mesophila]
MSHAAAAQQQLHQRPTKRPEAPWKKMFQEHVARAGGASAEFALSTVNSSGLPRVRYCIHRGFWAELPENEHNKLQKNPAIYESDCPTFTTDARMHKVYDLFATGKGKGTLEQSRSGTGGGGPVEAVYWVRDTKTQWRIRGKAWILAADDIEGGEEAQNSGTVTVKAELGRYMRVSDEDGHAQQQQGGWSWRREIENHFENLSPQMRGSFKNPPPGKPIHKGKDEQAGEALGQKAGHLAEEHLARKHFRVAVITPEEVEAVDLTDPEKATRQIWTLSTEDGESDGPEWNKIETWP